MVSCRLGFTLALCGVLFLLLPGALISPSGSRRVVLVVGASRGIGYELAISFAANGWEVHGTARNPRAVPTTLTENSHVTLHAFDVKNETQLRRLAASPALQTIDLLIHSAGVNVGSLAEQRAVNSEAPFRVVGAFLPALKRGVLKRISIVPSDVGTPRVIGILRARLANRLRCEEVDRCAYALSKRESNEHFRLVEPTWRRQGLTAIALQPGFVATDMNGNKGELTPVESAESIRVMLARLPASAGGKFLERNGVELSWETGKPSREKEATVAVSVRPPAPSRSIHARRLREGYTVLRQVFHPDEIDSFASSVQRYLETGGRLLRPNAWGADRGGWYIPAFDEDAALAHMARALDSRTQLHDALRSIFGEHNKYLLLSRRDIYVDYAIDWHRDTLHDAFAWYQAPSCVPPRGNTIATSSCKALLRSVADPFGERPSGIAWLGQRPRIVTVVVYLQDHMEDERGLKVEPHTHKRSTHGGINSTVLHTAKGDVAVFHTWLRHSGESTRYNEQLDPKASHRTAFTLFYGHDDDISHAFDRGFAMRNRIFTNASMCGHPPFGNTGKKCFGHHVRADLRNKPVPRRLYMYAPGKQARTV